MVKKLLALLLACALLLSVAGCAGAPAPAVTPAPAPAATEAPAAATEAPVAATEAPAAVGMKAEDIKAGFVYVGPATDGGWSQGHDEGRQALEKALGVKTVFAESVPENADCEKTIRNLIDQGCNVIFTTSFGFMDWTENVAKEFPDVKFFHCSGYKMADNFSNYFGRMYQARYLSGIAAGLKTKGKIGYVAAFPIPELVRGINAFTLGVRSVNPTATVEVIWTNTWFDPAKEKAAALELLNKGCDVMAQHQDSTATQLAAEEKGAFSVGYDIASPNVAPKAYLTAPVWHWSVYYIDQIQKIMDGTWEASSYWATMKDGIVSLDKLSALCAEGTQAKVDEATAKILSGEWDVFYGPLKDNTGAEKVAAGAQMTDPEMLSFDWFVEGVIGSVPKN